MTERIKLYRQIDSLDTVEALNEFTLTLVDRFGPVPEPVNALLQIVRLRWLAESLGFEKLILKNETLLSYFISDPHSNFYNSSTFKKMLTFVQNKPNMFKLREVKEKLMLSISPIISLNSILELFREMIDEL